MSLKHNLLEKINNRSVIIGILGLGYVGLPLAVSIAKKGVRILGFEKSEKKKLKIDNGENYIADVNDSDLVKVVNNKTLSATTDFSRISECDAIIVCVPTPLDKFKKSDMSFIESACKDIGKSYCCYKITFWT